MYLTLLHIVLPTPIRIRNGLLPRSSRTTIHTKSQRTLTRRVSVHRSSLVSKTMGVGPSDPTPSSSEVCVAVSGRTYEPGGHRQPAEHPRPARTARPHCCRPSAAVPSSPEPELVLEPELGRPSEPGQEQPSAAAEPEQPSAAAEPEQPSAAGAAQAYMEPWPQHHRPSPLSSDPVHSWPRPSLLRP